MEPTAPDLEVLNLFYFITFSLGLVVGAFLTTLRLILYLVHRDEPPILLIRDVVARVTLSLPFGGILLLRTLRIDPMSEWWGVPWVVASGALAVLGVWVYVYYEAFIIER